MFKQYTISRDDSVYECFPDVTKTKSGKLICVFRESTHHGDLNGSRLVLTESLDGGKTWSAKRGLTERVDASHAYNCPRISCMESGELVIICDNLNRVVYTVDTRQRALAGNEEGSDAHHGLAAVGNTSAEQLDSVSDALGEAHVRGSDACYSLGVYLVDAW